MSFIPGMGGKTELVAEAGVWNTPVVSTISARLREYARLARPRIALMTSISVFAGFLLASTGSVDWVTAVAAALGISAFVAASSVLNQVIERSSDARMDRTADRALVTGRVSPAEGWLLGTALALGGFCFLAVTVNAPTATASLLTMLTYAFVYTPAKRRTALCTTIGAIPGAMPPVLGWLACRGTAGVEALALFAIFFVWQFPHFLAIGWIHREDYRRAGLRMLPSFTDGGRLTAVLAVIYALAFVPVSLLPRYVGMAGDGYLAAALLLSTGYLILTLWFASARTVSAARRLMTGSLICLPVLLLCLVADFMRLTT